MPYTICVNKPGYLPETDPETVETLEQAIEAAEAAIDISQQALGDEPEAMRYFDEARGSALSLQERESHVIHMPDGYVIDVQYNE